MFTSAWWYYQRCVFRNRATALLRQLRQPKYVIGLVLTVGYLYWVFLANPAFTGHRPRSTQEVQANARLVMAAYYLGLILLNWLAASSGRGVVFREPEVQVLFPRPFTRWQILRFKWLSGQVAALISSLIIGWMLHRLGRASYPYAVAGLWINQSVLYANATLVALWLARLKAAGGRSERWTSAPAWVLTAGLAIGVIRGWKAIGDATGWEAAQALAGSPWLAAVTWPFTLLADLLLASDPASFATAAVVPLLLFAGHAWWIWRADFRFEDQAVEVAARLHKVKSEGMSALRSQQQLVVAKPRSPWRLAATGPAWQALVWKNVLSLGRLPLRAMLIVSVVLLTLLSLVYVIGEDAHVPTRIGFVLLGLLGYASLFAPSLVRVDLRIDIPHFDVLKAMPLRGRSLIFGEVMGTVLVLWGVQVVGTLAAAILIGQVGGQPLTWIEKAPVVVAVVCVFFAFDFTMVTSENLIALWLPGFARLGRGLRRGFENIGQSLLGFLIRTLVVLVSLVVPMIAAAVVVVLAPAFGLPWTPSISLAAVVFSALLCAEAGLLIFLSEGRYQRFDITSENVIAEAD